MEKNGAEMSFVAIGVIALFILFTVGCGSTAKPVQKITKPVDQTAAEVVKVRELKTDEGETRAVVSPADATDGQLKIKF